MWKRTSKFDSIIRNIRPYIVGLLIQSDRISRWSGGWTRNLTGDPQFGRAVSGLAPHFSHRTWDSLSPSENELAPESGDLSHIYYFINFLTKRDLNICAL